MFIVLITKFKSRLFFFLVSRREVCLRKCRVVGDKIYYEKK